MKNTYKKLADGTYGAWIEMKYNGQMKNIEAGAEVEVVTKAGETHTRIVAKTIESYKSGCIVRLQADENIAILATARYTAKVTANHKYGYINQAALHANGQVCPKCDTYCYGDCEA